MPSAEVCEVSKKVAMGGGTVGTMAFIKSSEIIPGPLGISPTKPNAEAPYRTASFASKILLIQQILTFGRMTLNYCYF
jgi:hypothetical protein